MKINSTTRLATAISLAAALATPFAATAQNAPQTSAAPLPAAFKTLLDNENVRVFESSFAPGVMVPMRPYPKRTVYVMKGPSHMQITDADGKSHMQTGETGSVYSAEPGKQTITNVGSNEVVVLVVVDKRDMPAQR